jgi:hypothetical protein
MANISFPFEFFFIIEKIFRKYLENKASPLQK